MFSRKLCIIIPVLTAIVYMQSCSPALYKPVTGNDIDPVRLEKLVQGRSLYVAKCGSCHMLHLPHQYPAEVWQHNLNEMQGRAKISDEEKELILAYILSSPKKQNKKAPGSSRQQVVGSR